MNVPNSIMIWQFCFRILCISIIIVNNFKYLTKRRTISDNYYRISYIILNGVNETKMKYILIFLISVSTLIGKSNVEMELIPEYKSIVPGRSFSIIVKATVKDEWYIYWRNPGDAGLPAQFNWDLPKGIDLEEMKWPVPEKIFFKDMASYGYKNEAAFFFIFSVSSSLSENQKLQVKLNANWLECKEKCIPGRTEKNISLSVSSSQAEINEQFIRNSDDEYPTGKHRFDISAKKEDDNIIIYINNSQDQFEIPPDIIFMPYDNGIYNDGAKQRSIKSDSGFSLIIPLDDLRIEEPKVIEGILKADGSFFNERNQNAIIIKSNIINNSEEEQE